MVGAEAPSPGPITHVTQPLKLPGGGGGDGGGSGGSGGELIIRRHGKIGLRNNKQPNTEPEDNQMWSLGVELLSKKVAL